MYAKAIFISDSKKKNEGKIKNSVFEKCPLVATSILYYLQKEEK